MAQPQAAQPLLIGLFLTTACLLQTSALLSAKRSSDQPCSVEDANLQHSERREEASLLQNSVVLQGNECCRCWELFAVPWSSALAQNHQHNTVASSQSALQGSFLGLGTCDEHIVLLPALVCRCLGVANRSH